MKLRILNESMTKLERAAKNQIEDVLNKQGYPTYSRLLDLFDVNLTADPEVIGYMIPGKAKIVLNKDLSIDQVSTIVRHEILHEFLTHAQREAALKEKDPKYKNIPHDLMNIAGDYEISNVGYTDADKMTTRGIQINNKTLRGLVTEDDHPDWVDKSFEEMLELLYDEYKDDMNAIQNMMNRIGKHSDESDIQQAEEIARQAQILEDEAEEEGDTETQQQASNISQAAQDTAEKAKENKEDKSKSGEVFNSSKEQKQQADLADRVEKIKKAFNDLKNKEKLEDENREAVRKEKVAKQARDLDKYNKSPIIRFKESLNKFIKDEISTGRGKTWTRFPSTCLWLYGPVRTRVSSTTTDSTRKP